MNELLNVRNLKVIFPTERGIVRAVEGVDLCVRPGECIAIVGESGCGKSVTSLAMMKLLSSPPALMQADEMTFDGKDLLKMSEKQMLDLRGKDMSMIFQDALTALNPVMTIGKQVEESLLIHSNMDAHARRQRALESMRDADLDDPESLYNRYPHELSGGMRQRVMIAAALVRDPMLLIADEPTTALDVTVQADILRLLKKVNETKKTAILFISHDLGVVRKLCSRVVVMKRGLIVEEGPVEEVFLHPREEYTKLLISSRPTRTKRKRGDSHE
jgi:peptide/nickel transport system ATP-binding protein